MKESVTLIEQHVIKIKVRLVEVKSKEEEMPPIPYSIITKETHHNQRTDSPRTIKEKDDIASIVRVGMPKKIGPFVMWWNLNKWR